MAMNFHINTASRVPIYQQLVTQVREGVARGAVDPGERLPSVRDLSREIVVNPNTVARAYTELEREGILNTRPGLGVFAAELGTQLSQEIREKKLIEGLDRFLTEAVHLGFSSGDVTAVINDRIGQFRWASERKAAGA